MSHDILLILFCVTPRFSTWHVAVWNRGFEMNVFGLLRLALSLWDHSVEELTESNSTNSPVGKGSTEILSLLGRTVHCWVEPEVIALVFYFVLFCVIVCAVLALGIWQVWSSRIGAKTQPESKCPELLANYCDMLLRKTPLSKKLTSEDVEKKLKDVVRDFFLSLSLQCFFLLFPTIRFCTWSLVLILLGGRGGHV